MYGDLTYLRERIEMYDRVVPDLEFRVNKLERLLLRDWIDTRNADEAVRRITREARAGRANHHDAKFLLDIISNLDAHLGEVIQAARSGAAHRG